MRYISKIFYHFRVAILLLSVTRIILFIHPSLYKHFLWFLNRCYNFTSFTVSSIFRIYKQYFSPSLPFNYRFPYIFYSSAVILAGLVSYLLFFLVLNLQIVIFAWITSYLPFFSCFNPTGSNSPSNLLNIYCL